MDGIQHIFELAEEGKWTNGRAYFRKTFYDAIKALDESQRIALVSAFDEVESPTVRFSILEAIQFLKLDVDVDYWINVMRDSDQLMAIRAKTGMVLAQRLDAADILLNEFVRESPGSFIAREIDTGFRLLIQESRPEELESILIHCLNQLTPDENPLYIIELLTLYKSSGAFEAITPFLEDHRVFVQRDALRAVASMGDDRAIPLIIAFLNKRNDLNDPSDFMSHDILLALRSLNIW